MRGERLRGGCGSSEWTGVRVLEGRRPVGREGSRGRNSPWRMPLASVASMGPLPSVFPVIVRRNRRQPGRIGSEGVFGDPQSWRRAGGAGPGLSAFSHPTPAPLLKGQEGTRKADPVSSLAASKTPSLWFPFPEPYCERHRPFCYIFLKQS